jgi:hypothetical protein
MQAQLQALARELCDSARSAAHTARHLDVLKLQAKLGAGAGVWWHAFGYQGNE